MLKMIFAYPASFFDPGVALVKITLTGEFSRFGPQLVNIRHNMLVSFT